MAGFYSARGWIIPPLPWPTFAPPLSPLRQPSVLTAKSLRRMLQISEGITANLFHIVNTLAIEAIESGQERITDAAVERWEPEFDAEAAFA